MLPCYSRLLDTGTHRHDPPNTITKILAGYRLQSRVTHATIADNTPGQLATSKHHVSACHDTTWAMYGMSKQRCDYAVCALSQKNIKPSNTVQNMFHTNLIFVDA